MTWTAIPCLFMRAGAAKRPLSFALESRVPTRRGEAGTLRIPGREPR